MTTEYTKLYMTVDDGETSFEVPTDWLEEYVENDYGVTLDEFMGEYTTEESENIYCAAILEGVVFL